MDVDGESNKKQVTEAGKYSGKDSKAIYKADQSVREVVDTSEMFSIFSKSFPGIYDEEEGICCLAKMYDFTEGTFRLNDMIEIVGIFTADPILCAVEDRDRDRDGDGDRDGDCNSLTDLMDPFRGFEDEEESLMLPPPR
jgi:Mini-chromosome maintenance replisome factor